MIYYLRLLLNWQNKNKFLDGRFGILTNIKDILMDIISVYPQDNTLIVAASQGISLGGCGQK